MAILATNHASAATWYWDTNGTTSGFGTASGTWGASTFFSTSFSGTLTTGSSTNSTTADTLWFGTDALGLSSGTIAVSGSRSIGSMIFGGASGTLSLTTGTITLAPSSTITVNNASTTLSSRLTGSGASLIKTGTGTLNLSGTSDYSGGTTLKAGRVVVASSGALGSGSGSLTLSDGVLELNTASLSVGTLSGSAWTMITSAATSGTRTLSTTISSGSSTFAGSIVNSGSGVMALTKSGAGTLVLAGSSSYTGGTTVSSGTLVLANGSALGAGTGRLAINSGLLDMGSFNVTTGGISGAGVITTGSTAGTRALTVAVDSATSSSFSGSLRNNAAGILAVVKSGSGGLTLSGSSSFTGGTTITGGTLTTGNVAALGSSSGRVAINAGVLNTGTVGLTIGSLSGGSGGVITTATNAGTRTVTIVGSAVSTYNGTIRDNGLGIVAASVNGGSLTLTGSNSYSGGTTLSSGTLTMGNQAALGSAVGRLTVNGGRLSTGLYSPTVGTLSGSGGVITTAAVAGTRSLTTNISLGTSTFAGTLADSAPGVLALVKTGPGTLTISGSNSFTGGTTVDGGALRVDGWAGAGGVSVNAGGTLSGQGTTGAVAIAQGGIISPGSAVGTLSVGDVTLAGGGIYNWQLFNAAGVSGSGWDLLSGGPLTVNATVGNPFSINLWTVTSATAGTSGVAANFNQANSYSWTIGTFAGGISGFSPEVFSLVTGPANGAGGFANPFTGAFSLASNGTDLTVVYTPAIGSVPNYVGSTGNWSTPSNWSPAIVPSGTPVVMFSGTAGGISTNDGVLAAVAGLRFKDSAGEYTVAGSGLALGADGVANDSVATQAVGVDMTLSADSRIDAGSGDVTVTGAIDTDGHSLTVRGSFDATLAEIKGSGGLVKIGPGQLTLSGSNSFTGGTTLSTGTLLLGSAAALGASSGSLTVNGGVLDAAGFDFTVGTLSGSGSGIITNSAGASMLTTTVASGSSGAVYAGGLRDGSAGTIALVKAGSGRLVLSGSNAYSGGTTITSGSLVVGNAAALGVTSAPLAVNGGTLDTGTFSISVGDLSGNSSGMITTSSLTGTRILTADVSSTSIFAGTLTGSGAGVLALTKTGNGSLTLSGSNRHTGGTTISAGTLVVGNAAALGTGTVGVVLNGGMLDTGTFSPSIGGLAGAAGTVVTTASTAGTRVLTTNIMSGTSTFAGSFRDNGVGVLGFTKAGAGVLALTGSSAYSGVTTVAAGTLTVGHAAALGGSAARVAVTGGTLDTGTFDLSLASLTGFGAVTTATAAGTRTLTVSSGSAVTFSGSLRDNGSGKLALLKQGVGRLTLAGSNSLSGGVTVQGGTLAVGGGGTAGSLGAGSVVNDAALVFDRTDSYGGVVGNSISGSGGVTLTRGLLTLSGSNSYSGGTVISSGTLAFDNPHAFGTGAVTVRNNAALAGTGTIHMGSLVLGSATGTGPSLIAMSVSGGMPATRLNVLGDITTAGTSAVLFSFGNALSTLSTGTYTLADYGGSLSSFSVFGYSGVAGARQSLELLDAAHKIDLLVANADVIWSGTNGSDWSTADNWKLSTDGAPTTFLPSDNVVFDDSGSSGSVVITNREAPSTITVTAGTNAYWLSNSGSGAIVAGALVKSGAGLFVVTGSNSFAGGTTLTAGELRVGGGFSLGSGAITITGGTLGSADQFSKALANPVSMSDDATLGSWSSGALTFSGTVDLEGGSRQLTIPGRVTISGKIVDGGLTKNGGGVLTLSGSNTYSGDTRIASGTLAIASTAALAGSTLDMAAADTGSVAFTASGTGTQTYSLGGLKGSRDIALGGDRLSIGGNGQTTTYAGVLSGSGGILKVGGGTLTLTGANTYTGTTTVGTGRLVGTTTSLRGAIVVSSGTLEFSQAASGTFVGALTGIGALVKSNTGTLTLTGTSSFSGPTLVSEGRLKCSTSSLRGNITNRAELEFDQAVSGGFSGTISGSGTLIKSGSGSLSLTPTSVVGDVRVTAGGLYGSTANFRGNIATSGVVTFSQSTNGEYAGVLSGTGSFVKNANGTVVLSGNNTLTGITNIGYGLLATASAERIADAATVAVSTMAGLRIGGNETIASLVGSGTVDVQSYQLTIAGSGSSMFGGSIIGSGGLTKAGIGTFTLTGSNGFLGNTNLLSGMLVLSNSAALSPSTTLTIGTGGTLVLNRTVRVFSYTNAGTITGTGSLLTSATAVSSGTISTPITDVTGTDGYAVGLEKNTDGTVVVSASNTFTGGIVVSAGTVQLEAGGAFAAGNFLEVRSGAAIDLNGQSQTFTDLLGDGSVALGGATMTVDATTSTNYSGVIASGTIVKSGSSSLTLSGTTTQTDATVKSGLLVVNGMLDGSVSVDAGGVLGGAGTIVGDLTVNGTQNPGNSPGIATVQGSATYNEGSTIVWELAGNTESNTPVTFDQINVAGDLTFAGPTALRLSFYDNDPSSTWTSAVDWADSFWNSDHSWIVFDVGGVTSGFDYLSLTPDAWLDGTDPGVAFATARPDSAFTLSLAGNDVVLSYTAVPEPATTLVVASGLLCAAVAMRRRRR
ncbi:MAG: autotransporter-associated beta strand repeat-containing protein [Planctomycetia bacterium]|nr:autotransporter-associated beta strand repeat-containing protein [Planctomycetia bacterium]